MSLRVRPTTLREANAYIIAYHRHHKPVPGARFSIGAFDDEEKLVGVAIVSRPVARMTDSRKVAEVTRLCVNGHRNACSLLYAACARACLAMGFDKIQTFILSSEPGTSLKAAGWTEETNSSGGSWSRPSRNREDDQPLETKRKFSKTLAVLR